MENIQFQSGYIIDCLKEALSNSYGNEKISGLLKQLSYFDCTISKNGKVTDREPDSLFLVANNILTRGIPTRPSLDLERHVLEKHNLGKINSKKYDEIGSISYTLDPNKVMIEKFYHSLHIIDPSITIQNLSKAKVKSWESHLGSAYEEDFLYNKIPAVLSPFWVQLLESQRELENILRFSTSIEDEVDKYLNGTVNIFNQQRIDFSIEFPYEIKNQRGIIIEIDGDQHEEPIQKKTDNERDNATEKAKWKRAIRFKTNEWTKVIEKLDFFRLLEGEEYFQIIKSNFNQPLYESEEGKTALESILIPFAVSRIQKVLIHLLITNQLSIEKKEWNIAVIERDVPCFQLAIQDFFSFLNNLILLKKESILLPECKLFIENIGYSGDKDHRIDRNRKYDLFIDLSILQRTNLSTVDIFPNAETSVTIRSAHSAKTKRKFLTSELIKYLPLGEKEKRQNKFIEDAEQVNILKKFIQDIFRKKDFRPGQVEILNRALQNKSVIGLLPTGSGKSLTYQLGALLQPGIALVIDPIKSLMKDQYEGLLKNGIDCSVFIYSSLNKQGRQFRQYAIEQVANANVLFAFVSPERLQNELFRKKLLETTSNQNYFSYCVIDEAHCVSEWGHDFRTSYLRLGENARKYCQTKDQTTISFFALTATASYDVLADVQRELGIPDEDAIVRLERLDRPELQFIIEEVIADLNPELGLSFQNKQILGETKQAVLHRIIQEIPNKIEGYLNDNKIRTTTERLGIDIRIEGYQPQDFFSQTSDYKNAGLVFCPHRNWYFGVTDNYLKIREKLPNLTVGTFMGGNDDKSRDFENEKNQELFLNNGLDILVATKAFGMGIDKPNIRYIIHLNYPSSIESYYQEVGRAGRDKKLAVGIILFNQQTLSTDIKTQKVSENGELSEFSDDHPISIDKDILLSFHQSNFKGIAKEKLVLNELLSEIKFPTKRQINILEDLIFDEFNEIVQLSAFTGKNGRKILYLHPNLGTFYLDRNNFPFYNENNSNSKLNNIVEYIRDFINQSCPNNLSVFDWLNQFTENHSQDGIEKLLLNPQKPNEFLVQIPFENNEYEFITGFLQKTGFDISENKIKELTNYSNSFDEFLASLKNFYGDTSTLRTHFLRIRGQQETFKAIYRLSLLGVVDDYTVDYNSKIVSVQVSRKEQGYHTCKLRDYLSLYNGSERVDEIMVKLPDYKGNTEIQKCLGCLIKFIYEEIAEQRNMAINAMEVACKIGLNENGNLRFKEFIDLYMNSKYARPEFLPLDTDRGLKADFNIVLKYMDLVKKDKGGEINNLKHLRGAATLLMVQRPENYVFILLKAFSVLLIEMDDAEFISEAQNDVYKGFSKVSEIPGIDFETFKSYFNSYQTKIAEFDSDMLNSLDEVQEIIFHKFHNQWLKKFNSKFIGNHERTNKRTVRIA